MGLYVKSVGMLWFSVFPFCINEYGYSEFFPVLGGSQRDLVVLCVALLQLLLTKYFPTLNWDVELN